MSKIIVVVRCYNEENNIERFLRGYSFADKIIISDGGSTDRSLEIIEKYQKLANITLLNYPSYEIRNDVRWNPDNPHMNFVINKGKEECSEPGDWIILDDMDDIPNFALKADARQLLEHSPKPQVNAFRLYMWGEDQFFPKMNGYFDKDYKSLWAWKPSEVNIYADEGERHGTIKGVNGDYNSLDIPYCLLHRSWHPDTVTRKMERYNKLELPMEYPTHFAGTPEPLPPFAHE